VHCWWWSHTTAATDQPVRPPAAAANQPVRATPAATDDESGGLAHLPGAESSACSLPVADLDAADDCDDGLSEWLWCVRQRYLRNVCDTQLLQRGVVAGAEPHMAVPVGRWEVDSS
jgi:hypothetical protein